MLTNRNTWIWHINLGKLFGRIEIELIAFFLKEFHDWLISLKVYGVEINDTLRENTSHTNSREHLTNNRLYRFCLMRKTKPDMNTTRNILNT